MNTRPTPTQFGSVYGADFEANTLSIEMPPGYFVVAGPVAIVPRASYDELVAALEGLMDLERRDRVMPLGREWDAARAAIAKATGGAA